MVVTLVMLALLGLGIVSAWVTSGITQIASNMNMRTQALYVAEAGVERARAILNANPTGLDAFLAGRGDPRDDIPVSLKADGWPLGRGAILYDGATALRDVTYPPASFARGGNTPEAMGRYTVWIRNDTGECRLGSATASFTNDENRAVVVRSQGIAIDGRTTVVLEVVLSPTATPGSQRLCLGGGGQKGEDSGGGNVVGCELAVD